MNTKIKNYFLYGGGNKQEFRKAYPNLLNENHKVWKLSSLIISIIFIVELIITLASKNNTLNGIWLSKIIIYSIGASLYITFGILLNTAIKPKHGKSLSFCILMFGACGIAITLVLSFLDLSNPVAIAATLAFIGFLYVDRPIKNYIVITSGLFIYLIYITAVVIKLGLPNEYLTTDEFLSSLSSVIIFSLVGLILSSFVNYRRIKKHIEIFNLEKIGNTDLLTNTYNKNKYDDTVSKLQKELEVRDVDFAVVVFDINRLKETNDTYGHNRGDELIIKSVELIKEVFQKSDVYRIGGDEFCCILTGEDYEHRAYLITNFHNKVESIHNTATSLQRDVSVAAGLATFDPGADSDYMTVFARADKNMYRNKIKLKADNKFIKKVEHYDEILD